MSKSREELEFENKLLRELLFKQSKSSASKPAGQKKKCIFGAFSEILFLSRMTDRLYDIQRTVVNRTEGFTEWKSGSPLFPNIRKSI